MLVAADAGLLHAEVTVSIRSDFKDRGIGCMLLERISRFATAKQVRMLESIESRDNHQSIEMEREMGLKVQSCLAMRR